MNHDNRLKRCLILFSTMIPVIAASVTSGQSGTTARTDSAAVTLPDSVVTLAKAAYEHNKCQLCHSMALSPTATKPDSAATVKKQRDLSSVGLKRTEVWLLAFLQKKEKLIDKLHMKTFAGTDNELGALARWLASQRADSTSKSTPGAN